MPRAVVENGVVTNTVMAADDDPGSVAIPDGVSVGIGWLYDGISFSAPIIAPSSYRKYTVAEFIEALTRDEALALLATIKSDPLLEMWFELAKARTYIDFNDPDTLTNAPYLVTAAVLTQERLDELTG
jgi:hypothetical protein